MTVEIKELKSTDWHLVDVTTIELNEVNGGALAAAATLYGPAIADNLKQRFIPGYKPQDIRAIFADGLASFGIAAPPLVVATVGALAASNPVGAVGYKVDG